MDYLKEPFDFRLFVRCMLKKWHQFVLCMLVGSLLFGGVYYLYKVVYAPAREYQAEASYYIEYVEDPVITEQGSYFNEATLNSWLTMDVFTDSVLSALSGKLTVEELDAYVDLIMPSDIRVVKISVKTAEDALTLEILKAYDQAFVQFGENQREINRIIPQDFDETAEQIKADIRTQRAFVLGAVLGLVFGGFYIVMKYLLDDGIYATHTLEKRHGVMVFGTGESEELAVNITYAVRNCKRVAVTAVGEVPALPMVLEKLREMKSETEWVLVPAIVQCPEAGEVLRGCNGVILNVMAGVDRSGAIDRALSYYKQQDVVVLGAILWNADLA